MYVLVTYDVAGGDADGARRLRRVAKLCCEYGQRVQYSVFECLLEPAQYERLKADLIGIIDRSKDSLRFYNLGKKWKSRVEYVGADPGYDPEGLLII